MSESLDTTKFIENLALSVDITKALVLVLRLQGSEHPLLLPTADYLEGLMQLNVRMSETILKMVDALEAVERTFDQEK